LTEQAADDAARAAEAAAEAVANAAQTESIHPTGSQRTEHHDASPRQA
jgi:hypothetical protein